MITAVPVYATFPAPRYHPMFANSVGQLTELFTLLTTSSRCFADVSLFLAFFGASRRCSASSTPFFSVFPVRRFFFGVRRAGVFEW